VASDQGVAKSAENAADGASVRIGRERFRRAALTSGVSAFGLGASVLTTLVTVPVLIRYLGAESYGVWLTIAGASTWLLLAQIGLAPSLLNQLATATGRGDQIAARRLVSTAWWYQFGICLLFALAAVPLYALTPWAGVLNTSQAIAHAGQVATTVVWLGIVFVLPTTIASAVFRAFQEGYIAAAWEFARLVLRLAAVLVAVALNTGMPGVAVAWVAPQVLVGLLASVHLFVLRRPEIRPRIAFVDRATGKTLLATGLSFTGISVAALVIWYADNLVIAQVLGPASVPRYAITFSVIQLVISIEMVVLDAAWPAYSEAAGRGDVKWLRSAHWRFTSIVVAIAVCFALGLLLVGRSIVRVWAGPAGEPSDLLIVIFAALVVVQSVQLAYGRLLTALGAVRANMRLGFVNAAINLPLSIGLAHLIGLPGVALGTLAGYAVIGWFLVRRSTWELERVALGAAHGGGDLRDEEANA
jgi:O-antigen/teichoic acid export membrane protein